MVGLSTSLQGYYGSLLLFILFERIDCVMAESRRVESFEGSDIPGVTVSMSKQIYLELYNASAAASAGGDHDAVAVIRLDEMPEAGAPQRCSRSWVSRKAVWPAKETLNGLCAAANNVLSALLYLFDFLTTISALCTYYNLQIGCRKSMALANECKLLRFRFRWVFSVGLFLMIVAHVANSLIFWMTLPAALHPLRFAYFLPLIHICRVLKVLWRACSCRGFKNFGRGQEEANNLYNVLAASLETTPQLILQFHTIMELGLFYIGVPPYTRVQVPMNLIVSLVASVLSGMYNGSMAVLLLVQKHSLFFPWRALILVTAGAHTLAAMIGKAIVVAGLADVEDEQLRLGSLIGYAIVGVTITAVFFGFVLQKSKGTILGGERKQKWRHALQSVALAHVSLLIGPMYAMAKLFDEPGVYLVWGTMLHVFVDLLGLTLVLAYGRLVPFQHLWQVPCYATRSINAHLTCNVYLGVVCSSLLLLLLSTRIFVVAYKRGRGGNVQPSTINNNKDYEGQISLHTNLACIPCLYKSTTSREDKFP